MRTAAEPSTAIGLTPHKAPRLTLRRCDPSGRPGPVRGRALLDGGWWPRSADPVTELPGLLLALRAHGPPDGHRPISHVLLRADDWDSHPRRLLIDGPDDTREVRLSWFDNLPAGLLTAIYADGRRIDLLTVPAATDHTAAQAALEKAANPADHRPAPDLPAALTVPAGPQAP
ncbi:DUF5994 family protein, partial [Actinomadura sp. 7K507]|uniref:DUF5994 family protein n=1 Tax=Actinomadura sp. 7K507 TaxID=2530365 RepID=UPI001047D260